MSGNHRVLLPASLRAVAQGGAGRHHHVTFDDDVESRERVRPGCPCQLAGGRTLLAAQAVPQGVAPDADAPIGGSREGTRGFLRDGDGGGTRCPVLRIPFSEVFLQVGQAVAIGVERGVIDCRVQCVGGLPHIGHAIAIHVSRCQHRDPHLGRGAGFNPVGSGEQQRVLAAETWLGGVGKDTVQSVWISGSPMRWGRGDDKA